MLIVRILSRNDLRYIITIIGNRGVSEEHLTDLFEVCNVLRVAYWTEGGKRTKKAPRFSAECLLRVYDLPRVNE